MLTYSPFDKPLPSLFTFVFVEGLSSRNIIVQNVIHLERSFDLRICTLWFVFSANHPYVSRGPHSYILMTNLSNPPVGPLSFAGFLSKEWPLSCNLDF